MLILPGAEMQAQFAGNGAKDQYDHGCQAQIQQEIDAAAAARDGCRHARALLQLLRCQINSPNVSDESKKIFREKLARSEPEYQQKCNGPAGDGVDAGGQTPGAPAQNNGLQQGQLEMQRQILDIQNQLDNMRNAQEANNQAIINNWRQTFAPYNNMTIGSESPSTESTGIDENALNKNRELLHNVHLDDENFTGNSPGESFAPETTPWKQYSESELNELIESEKKKKSEKTEEERCNEIVDDFEIPAELKIDSWGHPLDAHSFIEFILRNGTVLYEYRGLRFTYFIQRAVTEDGVKHKICVVDEKSIRQTGRNMANNDKVHYWYHLYYVLENKSDYKVEMNHFPIVRISMIGEETWSMCDDYFCKRSDYFGSFGVTSLSASPYLMWPHSRTYDFKGGWYPAEPEPVLNTWFLSPAFYDPTFAVFSKPKLLELTPVSATVEAVIIDDREAPIQSRGICWNTKDNPLIDHFSVYNGSGTGTYTAKLTGLQPNSTYYIRPFSTNSTGTSYGPQIIIDTPKP